MAKFEGYERREAKILAVLKEYGISSIDECKEICDAKGIDPYKIVEEMDNRVAAKAEANANAGKAFLAENAKKEGVVTLPSGLQYKVLSTGTGRKFDAKKDKDSSIAMVTYEGRKIDGTVFDSSDVPVEFPLDGVIPGFSEALKLMPVGSEWEIYIPSELAYGDRGPGIIGPNATLIFKLKLTDIKEPLGSQSNPMQLSPEQIQQLLNQQP